MYTNSSKKNSDWSYNFHEDSSQETSSQEALRITSSSTKTSSSSTTKKILETKTELTEEERLIAEAEAQDDDDIELMLKERYQTESIIDIGMVKEGNIKVNDNPFSKAKLISRMSKRNREEDYQEDRKIRSNNILFTPSKCLQARKSIGSNLNVLKQGFAVQAQNHSPRTKQKYLPEISTPQLSSPNNRNVPDQISTKVQKTFPKTFFSPPSPTFPSRSVPSYRGSVTSSSSQTSSPIKSNIQQKSNTSTAQSKKNKFIGSKSSVFSSTTAVIEISGDDIDPIPGSHSSTSSTSASSSEPRTSLVSTILPPRTEKNRSIPPQLDQSPLLHTAIPPSQFYTPSKTRFPAPSSPGSNSSSTSFQLEPSRRSTSSNFLSSSFSNLNPITSPITKSSKFSLPGLLPNSQSKDGGKILFKPLESLKDYKARLLNEEKIRKTIELVDDSDDFDKSGRKHRIAEDVTLNEEGREIITFGTAMRAFKPIPARRGSRSRTVGAGERVRGADGSSNSVYGSMNW